MDMQNITYRKIDENGALDASDTGVYVANNIMAVMGTWDFTIEELAAAGYVGIGDSDFTYANGMSGSDTEQGDITDNGDGTFTQEWVVTELSDSEKQDRFLTYTRSSLLLLSDWTQIPDSPMSDADKALWATYRQAIRDLPSTITWSEVDTVHDIDWPVRPGVTLRPGVTEAGQSDASGPTPRHPETGEPL
jgi:hypothetical protein